MKNLFKNIREQKEAWDEQEEIGADWDSEEEGGYYEDEAADDNGEAYYEATDDGNVYYEDEAADDNGEAYYETADDNGDGYAPDAQDGYYEEYVSSDEIGNSYYEDGNEYYEEPEDYYGDIEYLEEAEYYEEPEERERGGILAWFSDMTAMDKVMLGTGACILVLAIVTGVIFGKSGFSFRQTASFDTVGNQLEGIDIVGDVGLLAVADATIAKQEAAKLLGQGQEPGSEGGSGSYNETEYNKNVTVAIKTVSVQKDLKIKFVNNVSGKLIANVPFTVDVTTPDGKSETWKDDDMDGIVYKKGIAPGNYQVKVNPLDDAKYASYSVPTDAQKVEVKKDISYKKIDVSDEVKTESEINVATEEQKKQEPEVESTLTDTVEWVESTAVTSVYIEVGKSNIPEPSLAVKAGTFQRVAKELKLNPSEAQMKAGEASLTLAMEHSFEHVVSTTWKSSNSSVAEVDASGTVTAVAAGKATITCKLTVIEDVDGVAKEKEYTAQCEVTVQGEQNGETPSEPSTPSSPSTPSEPSTPSSPSAPSEPSTPSSSSAPSEPSTPSSSSAPSESSSPSQGIPAGEIGISVKPMAVTVMVKDTETVQITVSNANPDRKLVYSVESEDRAIATATADKNGKVTITGVKAGKTVLTVYANYETNPLPTALSAKVSVEVLKSGTISLNKKEVTAYIGTPVTVKATLGEGLDVTLLADSSDEEVATVYVVDKTIVITGEKEGTATVTVYASENNKISATCAVTVKKSPSADSTTPLKDKDGNQLYVQKGDGYREAVYADYYTEGLKFFKKGETKYTGWQTIDGRVYFFDKTGRKITGEQVIQGAKYNFGSDGALINGSGTMGIDVSKHNGNIDWAAVKNSGVSYVIIRCGYRGYTQGSLIIDPKFEQNIQGANAAGLKVGVYFFSQAVDEVEAVEEASFVLDAVRGHKISYPIFLDVEYSGAAGKKGRADGLDIGTRTAVCKAFCETIRSGGYNAGVYANKTWLQSMIDPGQLSAYRIWLAQYAATPTYTGRYDMWQYKSTGRVSGISGNVDMNLSYM